MTALELVGLLLRRWYVVVVCALLTAVGGLLLLDRPPVYYTQFEVVLLPPNETVNPNTLREDPYGMVPMAGLLVEEYNEGHHPLNMSTTETTLYGEGLTRGERVRMRNVGNQWLPIYDHPVIDVQIVDPDAARVESEAARIAGDLDRILDRRQSELHVRPRSRMSTEMAPEDVVVQQITGSRARTAGGLALLGGSLTVVAVIGVERLSRARAARRSRPPEQVAAVERELISQR
ncbi:hypothetical protein J2S40_000307 [Nocardioides luteus]|uniref:Polysaccharide chain length determinant N-terminal domain-containing protein n=1 Tax=Nocardioides luteus TaxID=1844 RepID=A0ABQ5SV02_9ACTN|nr:hypothetical protein [Nocardioides luteus]MDR7309249.1 hypothetical protein [Nocardioides luteus]GGR48794.1 hypothetical protein GCM10010197_13230 [Nocardioides luteus]GLJ67654.1 hypothetical protein GCM10017579_16900 [Nocardioides luteus]